MKPDIDEQVKSLLGRYSDLRLAPIAGRAVLRTISGMLCFEATDEDGENLIIESFQIEMNIPEDFPCSLPKVKEIGGRVPEDFHQFPQNQTLCLGSPLRLRIEFQKQPTLLGFVNTCVIPYFYGFARYQQDGRMPFNELAHGVRGLLDDYRELFGVSNDDSCIQMLKMLSLKKRVANKLPCPCGSGKRLGICHQKRLNPFREVASRSWFKRSF